MGCLRRERPAMPESAWLFAGTVASRAIQPLVSLILARFLAPADFGIVGMAAVITGFVTLFADGGLGQALIREDEGRHHADIVFSSALVLGLVWYTLLYVSAPFLAAFYRQTEVGSALRVLALPFLWQAFHVVPNSFLAKKLAFRKLCIIQCLSLGLHSSISILLALANFGFWAIVLGGVLGNLLVTPVYWFLMPWRARFRWSFRVARPLFLFGGEVSLGTVLQWLLLSADTLLVGRVLGPTQLGIYRIGFSLGMTPYYLLAAPFAQYLYPTLCKMVRNGKSIRPYYSLSILRLCGALLACMAGLAFAFPYLVPLVLGEKWGASVPISLILLVNGALLSVMTINGEVCRAIGQPGLMTRFYFVQGIFSLPVFYFATRLGLVTLSYAHVGLAAVFALVAWSLTAYALGKPSEARIRLRQTGRLESAA